MDLNIIDSNNHNRNFQSLSKVIVAKLGIKDHNKIIPLLTNMNESISNLIK